MRRTGVLLLAWLVPCALGQESTNFKLNEHVVNAGGRPLDGVVISSPHYLVTFDGVGGGMTGGNESPSYKLRGGFQASFPPPGEVHGLSLTDVETLIWSAEGSAGTYNIYRDLLSALSGHGYGGCEQHGIVTTTTVDPDLPPASDGYFYLVTVRNRLAEEGTKGDDSAGQERDNPPPCP
jgi:hypothetical protein